MKKPIAFIFVLFLLLMTSVSCGPRVKKNPHILLITIDTLRRDHVGAYGYPRNTTPFIDSLAKKGTLFKHVVTPQPQTSGSHASILTSLHPVTHGLIFNTLNIPVQAQTIAEVLQQKGYYTIGTVATFILGKKYGFAQGFDSFSDSWDPEKIYSFKDNSQRTAASVNQSLFKQINEYKSNANKQPLFIWVHYYDPHTPYIGRKEISFKTKHPRDQRERLENYDREIRYTDNSIKALYSFLEDNGIAENMITCVTSDHGENFGEHSLKEGHVDFYAETTHVPLIIQGPGIPVNKTHETYVSTMDIAVTLLGQVKSAFDYLTDGIDLFKSIAKDKKKPLPDRKFLIYGTHRFARSLQIIGAPYSYIENFDFHYKYWYTSLLPKEQLPVSIAHNRFKKVPESWVESVPEKGIKHIYTSPFKEKGIHFLVLRADIRNRQTIQSGVFIWMETLPKSESRHISIGMPNASEGKPLIYTAEVLIPISVIDRLKITLRIRQGDVTDIQNLRYAVIPAEELGAININYNKNGKSLRHTSRVWKMLLTKRKYTTPNEFYHLVEDILMKDNLIETTTLKPLIIKLRKLVYDSYFFYRNKSKKLLKGHISKKELSPEDEKTLKSLGYL
jgi:arylsulfatase A-like enzyme